MSFETNRSSLDASSVDEELFLLDGEEKDGSVGLLLQRALRRVKPTWRERLTRPRKETLPIFIVVSLTIFSLLLAAPRLANRFSSPVPTLHLAPNDYILDPDWDFAAEPRRREYSWTISDAVLNPDGVFRPMIVINNQFPGPLIECNEGDTIVVSIRNQAANSTSIHWHGMYQNGSNWMDGTVGVTQCPIAPGASFTYEFNVTGQSGTYFYHGHHGAQAADGLLGPLVIHSRDEKSLQKLEYATDRVVMVQDHYYDLSGSLLMDYLKPDMENAEPVPASALINGRNVRNCDDLPNRRCDNSTASLPVFDLEPNKNHRLRFINVGAFAEFQVQIDEHEWAVTEVDGTDVHPINYHRLNISPAQRYSIVLRADKTDQDAFWLRARMVTHCFAEKNPEMMEEVRGIVQYASQSSDDKSRPAPSSRDWPEVIELQCRDLNTTELRPVIAVAAPPAAATVSLRSNFEIGAWKLSRGFFNASSWRGNSKSPSLQRFITGVAENDQRFVSLLETPFGVNSQAFEEKSELVYQTSGVQVLDIVISNFDDGNHPMHLHGYKFFVLAQGHGYPPEDLYEHLDLSNPLRRDTASVEAFGWVALRFIADNPGMWAFHCHINWHAEAGLLMQFLTRADKVAQMELPESNTQLCKLDGITKGDNPGDWIWAGKPGSG